MHFHGLPERLLGSKARVAVLKVLVSSPGAEWTGREVGRKAGVSPTQALSALRAFEAEGFCSQRRIGRSSVWQLLGEHFIAKALAPLVTLDEAARLRLQKVIERGLQRSGAREAFLFGSVSSGREEAGSDVDLLVIFTDKQRLAMFRRRLEPLRATVQAQFASFLSPTLMTVSGPHGRSAKRLMVEARRTGIPLEVGR